MTNEEVRLAIEAVKVAQPRLTAYGFSAASNPTFNADRAEMLSAESVEQFIACCEFIAKVGFNKTWKARSDSHSYGQKAHAERWAGIYIANGIFIAAAVHMGAPVKECPSSPNAYIGLRAHALARVGREREIA